MRAIGEVISVVARIVDHEAVLCLEEKLGLAYQRYRGVARCRIPPILVKTLLAAEDHRFDRHSGVDLLAIARALWCVFARGILVGGSTIEQQLTRTLTGRYERRLQRKAREVLLAPVVCKTIPKREIPGLYLSLAYFGWRMNGIEDACLRLGYTLPSLTAFEAASLVARLKYPEPREASLARKRQITNRTRYILRMVAKRYPEAVTSEGEVKVAGILSY